MNTPKVSVVVPIYKVEKYIQKSVISLFNQTLDSIEYIFVDDCSPDRSIDIILDELENYPHRKGQVKFIKHEKNSGVSKSRQDGVDLATGEYIIQCDPDDWVDTNMYELLYNKAKEIDADMVICDYFKESQNRTVRIDQRPEVLTNKSILDSISGVTHKNLFGSLWNKLIKCEYYKKSIFPKNISHSEDVFLLFQVLQNDNLKINYVNESLYHYVVDRPGSLVKIVDEKAIKKDLDLIDKIMAKEPISDINENAKKSYVSFLIFRAFINCNLSNKEFKEAYGKFKSFIRYNNQIPKINKFLIKISLNGQLRNAQIFHSLIRKMHRGNKLIRKVLKS